MTQEASSSSFTSKGTKTKFGRTPEQQAARDARKAAKAAKAATSVSEETIGNHVDDAAQPEAESSTSSKRKRSAAVPEEEELEIDVAAPAPLSKAEARANRKKVKRGEAVSETGPKREYEIIAKKQKTEEGKTVNGQEKEGQVAAPKKQNSIWIGNLSFKTTEETLKDFILKGIVDLGGDAEGAVTRVNLPKKAGKGSFAENKGFAYVDFASPELQALGVGLSERFFEGRRVLIKRGDDHASTPNARTPKPITVQAADIKITSKHPESSSLYMGNLPFDATELGIRDLVEGNATRDQEEAEKDEGAESIGERGGVRSGLKKVRLGAFEDTGRCKGFAFLDFISSRHATAALSTRKNHFYGGRRLTVEYASEEAVKRGGGRVKSNLNADKKPRRYYESNETANDSGRKANETQESNAALTEEGEEGRGKKNDKRGKKWEVTGRPRPGAALAMAKRENVAIVQGEGKKITFD